MFKSIENASSASLNFDTVLLRMSEQGQPAQDSKKNSTQKQSADEFTKGIDLSQLEDKVSELIDDSSVVAQFSTDKETDKLILKLIDKKTGEVVKQYPPEITLKIARMVDNIIENDNLENVKI
jgi:flagellar protein FlaG